ncbi:hypothetical protein BGZ54_002542 [Gamsiella multidivaricata]|nr:hypothetical protein BGZ54_002542 [Gamsiella multidivaricata]
MLVKEMKKTRNSKQLSLKMSPSPGNITIDDSTSKSANFPMNIAPSPSFPPSSTSLSSRRRFTPAPLASASLHTPSSSSSVSVSASTSKRKSQLLLDNALPTPRLPLPTTTSHRSISAYFSDYSLECGAASPYTSEPVCVLPNLYLGAEHNATDIRTLQRLGITFVLNVAIEIAQENSESKPYSTTSKISEDGAVRGSVHFKSLAWTHHQKSLLRDFPAAFALIDEAIACNNGKGKALVHCQLGVSRSASLVIAYVMRSLGMGLTEAYDFVKQRSGVISPNMSLMYQLAEYEKSLKNPGVVTVTTPGSPSDSTSARSRNSWSSQLDDDEPPYPFLAAFSDTASFPPSPSPSRSLPMFDDCIPPSTPVRQEFCKRPLTPENGVDHPNTKPFQSSSRLANPRSFLSQRRNQGSRPAPRSPMDLSRSTYQRSPLAASASTESLTPTEESMSPKTPTAESFASLRLDMSSYDVEMVPPTPLFQSSFTIPPLSSSSSSSSASSVSSFEGCSRPSISSTSSSSSSYFTACDDEDGLVTNGTAISSPRNSGTWSLLPSTLMLSSSEAAVVVNHEDHEPSHHHQQQQGHCEQSDSKKKKRPNPLWSGLKALQAVTEPLAGKSAETKTKTTTTTVATAVPTSTSTTPSLPMISTGAAGLSKTAKLPDFIFSPRSYTPTHPETRSFGEFYQVLCLES